MAVLAGVACTAPTTEYDVVILNGRVMDPETGIPCVLVHGVVVVDDSTVGPAEGATARLRGYAKDGGALMQKSVSVGFAYQPVPQSDVLGVGLNWGEPSEDTFGPGLRDQYTGEVCYRLQVTPRFAVTPTLQLLVHPALDPVLDRARVFGLRARTAL